MAFHDTRLPVDIERGAVGGPRFKTTILQLASGHEQRNIDWQDAKGEWDISYGLMSLEDNQLETYIRKVLAFFYARNGRAHGFRFKDWSDYKVGDPATPTTSNQAIGVGNALDTQFQVYKRYSDGGVNFDRTIKKLVNGKVVVLLNGVVQGGGFTIDYGTGIITFAVAPGVGVVVGVACEFDVPVRFDEDHLKINMQTADAGQIPSIPIVELRNPA